MPLFSIPMTGFLDNLAIFQQYSSENCQTSFQKKSAQYRKMQLNFMFLEFYCSFGTSTAFRPNFSEFLKNRPYHHGAMCSPNFQTLDTALLEDFQDFQD
jgi:hypothetical protein